jgi:beta-phosphoglucomutase
MNHATIDTTIIQAAIFDMDGTMVNNGAYHTEAWGVFCQQRGLPFEPTEFQRRFFGQRNKEVLEALFKRSIAPDELAQLAEEKEALYRQLYEPFIHEVRGLSELFARLRQHRLKIAVATSAPVSNRVFTFQHLGIKDEDFDAVVGGEDVRVGKPDPEMYLTTAKRLRIAPQHCVVFEDSYSGVQAGTAAGMQVIGVLTGHTPEELHGADDFVEYFDEVELTDSNAQKQGLRP